MDNPRWVQRPEGANWGDFSPDDQLGRLNLITPEKVRQGVAEVREGVTFSLSLPLDYPGGNLLNPRRYPPVLRPTMRETMPNFNAAIGDQVTDVVCDDLVILHLQYSTQWDALCHVGSRFDADGDGVAEKVYYNGFRADEDIRGPSSLADCGMGDGTSRESTSGATRLGIEGMAAHGVQGRAVMVDLRAHYGDARTFVGYDELMRVMEADGVEVETGDMVCLHTGFGQRVLEMRKTPDAEALHSLCAVLNGRDGRLLNWISDSGLAVLIADNYAVEGLPAQEGHETPCAQMPLHEHCLFKNGIHLGELWHLTPLAEWLRARGRYRFLLTAPPLRLPGAVGSPANPIATV
ncbi:cyclase [Acuticoccus sediminis]|uniref:Cyclase n=1 Tax=Acuticoccus sediminis TaxID=2184697 RepID=A0A8B2NXR1_9HYPH|nr:cyclase family protein [Acuticoccus sediminis]RAI03631.1 cyclase [Acuticoccus sediminis]